MPVLAGIWNDCDDGGWYSSDICCGIIRCCEPCCVVCRWGGTIARGQR